MPDVARLNKLISLPSSAFKVLLPTQSVCYNLTVILNWNDVVAKE